MSDAHPVISDVSQLPLPGDALVLHCGDSLEFILKVEQPCRGRAYVRTNLGAAVQTRQEIIRQVEKNEIKLGADWVDLPMVQKDETTFAVRLPLTQTGHFQAKCFFLSRDMQVPVWPPGENTVINVEPAGTCCANIIYNAFVRQFGPNRAGIPEQPELESCIEILDGKGYTVIPESGKFRDLKDQVGFIFGRLGCRALHLLPIHPTPTTYARMGRFGSPYAALDFTDVDPALAVFDPAATPLEQFFELADAVHAESGYLILDIAVNHTGWAASIHESNPEWLDRADDGRIQAPGAWGVVWEDLTRLDWRHRELWQYMAGIFLLWCGRGVDGFRCDAGYMIPVPAWEYMIAKVRRQYPDTIFLLEGLGGPLETTQALLGRANFNWAYSELFQNYTADEIARYHPFAEKMSRTFGHLVHFAETHDNDRLAKVSHTYAGMRTGLCALFSSCGGFGFANGVEWFATQKINVHGSPSLNWGNPVNQVDYVARLILILREHPAFWAGAVSELIQEGQGPGLTLLRKNSQKGCRVIVLVNLDCEASCRTVWPSSHEGDARWFDLISGRKIDVEYRDGRAQVELPPGGVMALTQEAAQVEALNLQEALLRKTPARVLLQKRRAQVLSVITALRGCGDLGDLDIDRAAMQFAADPVALIRSLNPLSAESRVVVFNVPGDLKRQVMVPPGFFLVIQCPGHFRAELVDARYKKSRLGFQESLPSSGGDMFHAVFMPIPAPGRSHRDVELHLRIFKDAGTQIETGRIRYLPPGDTLGLKMVYTRSAIARDASLKQLSTTRRGAMMRAAADFSRLASRYDGLLGANLSPDLPEDRWMLLARYRAWGVFQGYSRQLCLDSLSTFWASFDGGCRWRFRLPTSEGRFYVLSAWLLMDRIQNRVTLTVHRETQSGRSRRRLEDHRPVSLIVRPDIEDRSFHSTVKAYTGPEHEWPQRVEAFEKGFSFSCEKGGVLQVSSSKDRFFPGPEWQYMVERPVELERGLDAHSDLFSPGFFRISLKGGETVLLEARVSEALDPNPPGVKDPPLPPAPAVPFHEAAVKSLDAFVVDRNGLKSVIAGFPWFLDWGRDSLIFCRSLIQAGRIDEALAVLTLFGQFEREGTLPNMICGADARNIETSDAPLWFFACCRQMTEQHGPQTILDKAIGGRTFRRLLFDMAESMIRGTPTGVKTDPDTFLLFSPAHFTWMDTNFPAATPREGFPVEIQALWHYALEFLSQISPEGEQSLWAGRADRVRKAVMERFWMKDQGYFADCLSCREVSESARASVDDALRPNQLLLLTLGTVTDREIMQRTVETCQELLVPGAIRSLADRPVIHPHPVEHEGRALADPHAPYAGFYRGDEDTKRKPSYHNGTAWTWLFPVFCEAWAEVFGPPGIPAALAWLGSALPLMRTGAAGFVPEILDGDFPHRPRGCDAQAWGSSEIARVALKLTCLDKGNPHASL